MPSSQPRKPPVIKDVAREAGVSVPTVSRVLTGAAKVSDDKRRRVQAAIERLGYRPSPTARALVAGQPRLIAVLAGNTSHYGYAETIRGIEEQARGARINVTITVVESPDPPDVRRAVDLVMEQSLAGVLVLKFDAPGVAALQALPGNLPVVAISGVRDRRTHQAVLAESAAARELVRYLLGLGHRTVYHVRVPPSRREDGRTTGWRRALRDADAPVPEMVDASWDPESGREIGLALAAREDVTAVFCGNDEIAMGVIRGLHDGGRRVPGDVSVVGFDDHPLARLWTPSLTTVRQDFAELGSRAFYMLEDLIHDRPTPQLSSQRPQIVFRESVAPPPGPSATAHEHGHTRLRTPSEKRSPGSGTAQLRVVQQNES